MKNERIVIIDYGAGNLHSVANAVSKLGYNAIISSAPEDISRARAVILPGVGAAADTMAHLRQFGLDKAIKLYIGEDRPFLGVCIGLQVLMEATEEGNAGCMGVFKGTVKKLKSDLKIPHMGWNQVRQRIQNPIFEGIPDNSNFYFVHSYYAAPVDKSVVAGETEYGETFCSVIARGNLVATQFHPEKSAEPGLKVYDNFIRHALAAE